MRVLDVAQHRVPPTLRGWVVEPQPTAGTVNAIGFRHPISRWKLKDTIDGNGVVDFLPNLSIKWALNRVDFFGSPSRRIIRARDVGTAIAEVYGYESLCGSVKSLRGVSCINVEEYSRTALDSVSRNRMFSSRIPPTKAEWFVPFSPLA